MLSSGALPHGLCSAWLALFFAWGGGVQLTIFSTFTRFFPLYSIHFLFFSSLLLSKLLEGLSLNLKFMHL